MCKPNKLLNIYLRLFLLVAVLVAVIYLIIKNVGVFGNVLLVVLGFGAVVLIHEFGHFVFAKLCDIKVEAFSIGFPPILAGVLRTENGYRIRILPGFFRKEDGADGSLLTFTIGKKAEAGETEYRIGLIPVGGFVKMLGQEDVGSAEASDDPRSYANKPVGSRMAVIAAGVCFNAISAIIIFMIVFLIGIRLTPAVVGGVRPNSPAAKAGLRPGDEIIEIAGKSRNLDYYDVAVAAALSDKNEEINLKARHEDGTIENYTLVAEQQQGDDTKRFGIALPLSLNIAKVSEDDANNLYARTGLIPGDCITAANGKDVQNHWELMQIVQDALTLEVAILAKRNKGSEKDELVESQLRLDLIFSGTDINSESDLGHIYSMVPRLQLKEVTAKKSSWKEVTTKMQRLLEKMGIKQENVEAKPFLKSGDIVLAIGEVGSPTYKEFREIVKEYEDRQLPIQVLRTDANNVEESLTINVKPKRWADVNEVLIGIQLLPTFDAEHPVIAKTIDVKNGPARLAIPRGAVITAIDGVSVSSFYDIIREIRRNTGQNITINYRLNEKAAGEVTLNVDANKNFITVESAFAEFVPFKPLERLYKATGPVDAIRMGFNKTAMFIAQTYVTLKRLIAGLISPKNLMGPVGIITFSYRIVAERPLIDYVYFISLISAVIVVFNFLPILPLDGGHILFLLIEKIKGSPVSERVQISIANAGWVLVGALFIYLTFNDIVRSFFS